MNTPHDDSGLMPVQETTDTAQTIKELNSDELDKSNFSGIDLKTRLHSVEISSIIAVDSLIAMEFLPTNTSIITRSKKRLAVSLNGLGRSEIVQISQGMQEKQAGRSMFERMGSMFGGGK